MSTRATISLVAADQRVKSILLFENNSPDQLIKMLVRDYNTYNKVNNLISLGNITSFSNDKVKRSFSIYDKTQRPKFYNDLDKFISSSHTEEYNYIFWEGAWFIIRGNSYKLKSYSSHITKNYTKEYSSN